MWGGLSRSIGWWRERVHRRLSFLAHVHQHTASQQHHSWASRCSISIRRKWSCWGTAEWDRWRRQSWKYVFHFFFLIRLILSAGHFAGPLLTDLNVTSCPSPEEPTLLSWPYKPRISTNWICKFNIMTGGNSFDATTFRWKTGSSAKNTICISRSWNVKWLGVCDWREGLRYFNVIVFCFFFWKNTNCGTADWKLQKDGVDYQQLQAGAEKVVAGITFTIATSWVLTS